MQMLHRTLRRNALCVALGLALVSGGAIAQSAVGSLFGKTTAGAQVTVESKETGTTRQITADSEGRFQASQLPPGTYTVTAGGVSRTVTVRVGTGSQVDLESGDGGSLDVVRVVGGRINSIDVSSTESTTTLTAAEIQALPVQRDVTNVALLAPGTVRGDTGFGNLASFGGASVAENGYYINGFDVTNIRTFLSYATLPFEAVAEQQTKTGGYGAEYGRSLGGVINIVTKRGTNDFHYGGSVYWSPESLAHRGKDVLWANPGPSDPKYYVYRSANGSEDLTYNAYASGPIVRDRLFFFGLVSGKNNTSDVFRREDSYHTSSTSPQGLLKLDWNITDNHRLELTAIDNKDVVNYRFYHYPNGGQFGTTHGDLYSDYDVETGGRLYIGKYTGYLTDNLTLSLEAGRLKYSNNNKTPLNLPGAECVRAFDSQANAGVTRYVGCWNQSQAIITDPNFGKEMDIRNSRRLDVEWILGPHTVRFGYDGEKFESGHAGTTYTGGEYWRHFYVYQPAGRRVNGVLLPQGTYYARRWISNTGSGSYSVENTAVYLEDAWQVTDNWLIYAGLRNETFDNKNGEGATFVKASNNIAPRLGFSWDMHGNGTAKLFGSAGRYYIPVSSNTNIRGSGSELFTEEFFLTTGFDPATGLPTGRGAQIGRTNVTSDGSIPDPRTLAATNLKPMYQDEFILGYQKQLNSIWTVGIKGVYRSVKNGMDDWCSLKAYQDFADDNGYTNFDINSVASCFLLNPGRDTGVAMDVNGDGNLVEVTIPAHYFGLPKYKREYRAIELSTEGRGDRWWLQGSYTWSKSYGNVEGYVNSSLEQEDAGATQDFDNEHFEDGAYGYLPNDRRHTLKLFGNLDVSSEWSLGGNLLIQSGRPVNCFGFVPTFGNIDDSKLSRYSGSSFYCKLPDGTTELRSRGSAGRTPTTWSFDASVTYVPSWARKHLKLNMTVFNLFNNQTVTEYNEFSATGSAAANTYDPNFLNKVNYQTPRSVMFSARVEF